jgi:hypothetical protein
MGIGEYCASAQLLATALTPFSLQSDNAATAGRFVSTGSNAQGFCMANLRTRLTGVADETTLDDEVNRNSADALMFIESLRAERQVDKLVDGRPRHSVGLRAVPAQPFQDSPCSIPRLRDSGSRLFSAD